ncbi:MAG: ATP-binding protein, partial [Deltaproteobacteria bacterium]|nr:ATP-binding protein [Deltaproteobacteria bacterium]
MKLFKRKLQQKIKPWLDKPDIVGILGARQVGKTTLLSLLKKEIKQKWGDSKNILTYNLEDADQLYALNRDPKYFNEYCILSGADPAKESIVLIDEIQYLDEPSHFLKYIADFEPSIKLIITGSTSINIKKYKDSVTGRKKLFTLFPLDFQEFLLFKCKNRLLSVIDKMKFRNFDLKKIDIDPERIEPVKRELGVLFEEYMLYGGYPKVVLAGAREEKLEELKELYEAYELKDVNILFDIANITAFRNLFKILAGSVGCLLNVNELSGTIGIGRDTVRRYLSVLENSFIISTLQPFHSNIRKELIKMPKLFFQDTGLRNFALRNFSDINFRTDKGSLFENAIFGELFKNLGVIDQLYFWRTISKSEVDFVFTGERKLAFEVKSSSASNIKVHKGLKAFKKIYSDFEQI